VVFLESFCRSDLRVDSRISIENFPKLERSFANMADIILSLTVPPYTWPLLVGSAIIYLLMRRLPEKTQWSSTPPLLKEKTAAIHLTGDQVVSPETLDYLENMRDQWQIPGVSIAIVRMNKDGVWEKQTIGMGRKDAEGNQVTERVGQGTHPFASAPIKQD
jgi:hypothetical protein